MLAAFALAAALSASPAASADDFAARVLRGRLTEAGPGGPAYQKQFWAVINDPLTALLQDCIARNAPADKSPFTLVADLAADGHPGRIEAQPATPVARCTAEGFAQFTPPPPPAGQDDGTYPIEIDISIAP